LFHNGFLICCRSGPTPCLTHYMLCMSISEYAHLEHKYLTPYRYHGCTERG
jgi:hypothetical protein